MKAGTTVFSAIVFCAFVTSDTDKVLKKLAEAKAKFQSSIDAAREPILRRIEEVDSKARGQGDVDLVEALRKERALFESAGIVPKRFTRPERSKSAERERKSMLGTYRSKADQARIIMADAYAVAISECLKDKDESTAKRIKADFDAFRRGDSLSEETEAAKIRGSWLIASLTDNGKEIRGIKDQMWVTTFSKSEYTTTRKGEFMHSGTWDVDSSKDPMEFRQNGLKGTAAGGHFIAIYKWDGDDLIQCGGAASRPEKFESLSGNKHILMRLKRIEQ